MRERRAFEVDGCEGVGSEVEEDEQVSFERIIAENSPYFVDDDAGGGCEMDFIDWARGQL